MKSKKILRFLTSFAGEVINLFLIAVMLLFIGLGAYRMWNDYHIEQSAVASNYTVYKPGETGEELGFEDLKSINPDVVGWVTVYGTNIDYPVVQGLDNWEYLNTDAFGKYSLTGSIYLDHANSPDFSDFNSILYGHNMTPAVMFGNIKDFREQSFFETHRYGEIYFDGRYHGLEFFCTIECDAYDSEVFNPGVSDDAEKQDYLELLKKHSVQFREMNVKPDDRIVLLSTCSPLQTNIRDILVGRITDEVFEDPFAAEGSISETVHFDPVSGSRSTTEFKMITIIVLVIAAIIMILVIRAALKKKADRRANLNSEENSDENFNEISDEISDEASEKNRDKDSQK